MGAKKLAKRSKVKPFIKVSPKENRHCSGEDLRVYVQVINYSHLFPTRYAFELEGLKGIISSETFKEPSQREDAKKTIKRQLEERYQSGKHKWFFQPLRVRVRLNLSDCPSLALTEIPSVDSSSCVLCRFCSVY